MDTMTSPVATESYNVSYKSCVTRGKDQLAQTPVVLYESQCRLFFPPEVLLHEVYDPCPSNPTVDGLHTSWKAYNYVNPPFRDLKQWVLKALEENVPSIMIMPVRSSTVYVHRMLLPNSNGVVFWLNRIIFPPHKTPIPLPMMSVGLGLKTTGGSIRECPHVRLFNKKTHSSLQALSQQLNNVYGIECTPDMLVPRAWTGDDDGPFQPTGVSLGIAKGSGRHLLYKARDHCQDHPDATVLAIVLGSFFDTRYARDVAVDVEEVVFLRPRFDWHNVDGVKGKVSMVGSVVVVFRGSNVRNNTDTDGGAWIPAAFGLYNNGEMIGKDGKAMN
jgi:hypothetical protein